MRRLFSIRFKIASITLAVILAIFVSVLAVSYPSIQTENRRRSVEMMRMVGQEAQNSLDEYFIGIEQSVGMTANEAIDTLDSVVLVECGAAGSRAGKDGRTEEQDRVLDEYLTEHCQRIQRTFESVASHTHGVVTYYYVINPEVSGNVRGFYYSRAGKAGFVEQEPLDPRELDPNDTEHNAWYFTPLRRGRPTWVGPYSTPLVGDVLLESYLVPVYCAGTLVGMLGMDIPLDTLVEQVSPIRIYQSGFACLADANGVIIYHPELDQGSFPEFDGLDITTERLRQKDSGDELIRYTAANGQKRQLCFFTQRNGMKLVITAPVREINAGWRNLARVLLIISVIVIGLYGVLLIAALGLLTQPLRWLTAAAQRLSNAEYDVALPYKSRDEVGELTEAFRQMRDKLKANIEDLSRRVYTDDLTGLPNLRRFFLLAQEARKSIRAEGKNPAILYFNIIGIKHYNRQYSFEEGNELLRSVAGLLIRHFGEDRVCRVGQDHFAAITDEGSLIEELNSLFRDCQNINNGRSLPLRVGVYPDQMEDVKVNSACDRAKYACDLRRGTAVSGYTYFEPRMLERANTTRYVINHIDQAIEEKWIQVYYQPLLRAVNQKVCDEEALSRWKDPQKGMLSPGEFIPALEDSGLIYKLDLYVLDRILEKLRYLQEHEIVAVPQSVNLSRSDFDACDMVEEIRRRVDAAGIERSMITIEITESIVGSDLNFIKQQVERFQSLGFPVWMDDFGSGYSSLDVLQSIRFDLLKFDMSFMRKLNDGDSGKIILAKLMEMATAIGVDTVCEGVETEEQVKFLQDIGCSKLQGYYYSPPLPGEKVLERHLTGEERFGFEDAAEAGYYETVGRVNLHDLGVIAADESDAFRHAFNTLPMGVVEVRGETARFMRSNQSYRDFIRRYYDLDIAQIGKDFHRHSTAFMENVVKTCCEQGTRSFFDEKMPDGSTVHSFARRIGVNPVNGNTAVAVAVLSIAEPDEATTYADIARALAADYYNLYVIDLETDDFTEYDSKVGGEELSVVRRGTDFFNEVQKATRTRIYAEDREGFLAAFSKESVVREIREQGVFTTTYRLIDTGTPMYVNMKITRMPGGNRIIMGISVIDSQMKQQEQSAELRREREVMNRFLALNDGFLSLFTVDPVSGKYYESSSTSDFDSLGAPRSGEDFFTQARIEAGRLVVPEDRGLFMEHFTKEEILREIREQGNFILTYRLMIHGRPRPVLLKAASFREGEEEKLIVGVRTIRKRR